MAEEKQVSPEVTPKVEEEPKKEESAPKKKLLGKYESPEELETAYRDLESKLGQQSEEVRQSREFATVVQPLLDEIRSDPELFKQLDEKLRQKSQPTTPTSQALPTSDQGEMRNVALDLILARFEEKHSIDRMSPEERKTMRQSIGDTVFDLTGQPLNSVDLRRLSSVLDNAYILANKDKLIERSKLEALAQARDVEGAAFSSMPSSQGKSEETLTSEEATVAEKMGLTREQYLEGKKGLAKK